jgi:hypothetical protein
MHSPRFIALLSGVAALVAGCALSPEKPPAGPVLSNVAAFSTLEPGTALPPAWRPWSLNRFKGPSRYDLVTDGGTTVVRARARNSASGMIQYLEVDPRETPWLSWRWKVQELAPSRSSADDSPARVVVSFSGDLDKIPFSDRIFYNNFRLFSGQQLPYAALMYVWGSRTPKDGIVPNRYTSRIKIIAVQSGPDKLGNWQSETRNVREDFRRAFAEEPGKIVSIGILTETNVDNRDLETYYGDITFRRGCCH